MSQTYEEILSSMQNEFKTLAGFKADDASDIGIRLKVLAGEIFSNITNMDWLKNQMFPQTAVENQLDLHAQQRGITRKSATKARGILTFSRSRSTLYDIVIPEGTVCSTTGTDGLRYVTTEEVVFEAGTASINVNAEAEEGGSIYNTLSGTITVMLTPPPAVTGLTNSVAFTGGTDKETDEDLRERIMESYKNITNGTNAAFYRECALKYDEVYSASTVPRASGPGTVDLYVAGKGGVLSNSVMQSIETEINSLKEVNVDVSVKAPDIVHAVVNINIYPKVGYRFIDIKDKCEEAIAEYFSSLKIGEPYFIAGLGNAVFNVEGVKNYGLYSSSSDCLADPDELVCSSTVTITEGV